MGPGTRPQKTTTTPPTHTHTDTQNFHVEKIYLDLQSLSCICWRTVTVTLNRRSELQDSFGAHATMALYVFQQNSISSCYLPFMCCSAGSGPGPTDELPLLAKMTRGVEASTSRTALRGPERRRTTDTQ